MKISALGERRIVEMLTRRFTVRRNLLGFDNDCAAFAWEPGQLAVLTTDTVSEGIHYPAESHPRRVGELVAAVNFSDLAACGATPLGLLVAISAPPALESRYLALVAEGIEAGVARLDAEVLGGDVKPGKRLSISATAVGGVRPGRLLTRRGACVGDVVAVTGELGGGALAHLERSIHVPVARVEAARAAAATGSVTAATDLSDGLGYALCLLAGDVSFRIIAERLPVSRRLTKRLGARRAQGLALHFGGDYELLITVTPTAWPKVERVVKASGCDITSIGVAEKRGRNKLARDGRVSILSGKGWEHFRATKI